MAAQLYLTRGSEPSQVKTIMVANEESSFGEIVFCGDGL
jgi:hypothetical protein